jgi:TPR repeat protein
MHALAIASITLAAACAAAPPPTTPPPKQPPDEPVHPVANLGPAPTPDRKVLDHERACNEDADLWGCTIAGVFYHSGDEDEHIPMDVPKAARYLERGCAGKIAEACAVLILIYEGGYGGVAQDLDRANSLVMQLCGDGFDDYCKRVRAPVLE